MKLDEFIAEMGQARSGMEEAYNALEKKFNAFMQVIYKEARDQGYCDFCYGSGQLHIATRFDDNNMVECSRCGGTGRIKGLLP